MIETLVALLFAHFVADFVLQPNWMVQRKTAVSVLLAHIVVVALTAWVATGFTLHYGILVLALLHLLIDAAKIHLLDDRLRGFLVDQGLHILVLFGLAILVPDLYSLGVWSSLSSDAQTA